MAAKVIESPSAILQRNFSIHDLIQQERKTLKSSVKASHDRHSYSTVSAIPKRKEK
jgi:hypothetical protein